MTDRRPVSLSGQPVYSHTEPVAHAGASEGDRALIDAVSGHIEQWIGPVHQVFHEITSPHVHIDVHHVLPAPERPFHTLVTSGMAEKAMATPAGAEAFSLAELVVLLPPDWPLEREAFRDERNYWPIRELKSLARMPHVYSSWLWWGHSAQNGSAGEPYAPNTRLNASVLLDPLSLPEDFGSLQYSAGPIRFLAVVPIYPEELQFKPRSGVEPLLDRFDRAHVTDVIDPARTNTCKRWWSFRRGT